MISKMYSPFRNLFRKLKLIVAFIFKGQARNPFLDRHKDIISDPLNLLISRDEHAGTISENGFVTLHNGLAVPVYGKYAYYGDFSDILVTNRGVHEPLEEFAFSVLLKVLPNNATTIELGAYWGHYSMWLKKECPTATSYLVEPETINIDAGKANFAKNNFDGTFIQDFVGHGHFEIDNFINDKNLKKLDLVHCDIQGFEQEMLEGCKKAIKKNIVDYFFISTHSPSLHEGILAFFKDYQYRIEITSDMDDTTSFDGLIVASSHDVDALFSDFKPMGRKQISRSSPSQLLDYLNDIIV